jgi:large subunit ribosomal protein L35Ae
MKAIVRSFRRGRKNYKPRHFIIEVASLKTLQKAKEFIGKQVSWKSPAGKEIKGTITSTHGNLGKLRVVFERGLPGQAINTEVEVK